MAIIPFILNLRHASDRNTLLKQPLRWWGSVKPTMKDAV